jgi:hypothetical protein
MKHDAEAFFDADLEAEWQRQERAVAEERAGGAPAGAEEPARRAYRLIARAISEPELPQLPADFATRVARLAPACLPSARLSDAWFERGLPWLMATLFGGACALFVWLARDDTSTIRETLPMADGIVWWSALLGLSLIVARLPLPVALRSRLIAAFGPGVRS